MTKAERELLEQKINLLHEANGLAVQVSQIFGALRGLVDLIALRLVREPARHHRATRAAVSFGPITSRFTGATMATLLPSDSQVRLSVAYVDRHGNPTTVDSVPAWDTDRPDLLSVAPDSDGMSALIVAMGPVGLAQVSVRTDAARGAPVRELVGLADFEVVAAEAVTATISAGDVEPQP